ncbi:MAG: hopanoid biosynthesis-associated protein HpnK [Caulobacteraceae bacterium]
MKGLIVTADDFGASPEVNEAVEIAYRKGVLTTASLMVGGPAAADAVQRAKRLSGLRVGLHVVLVEGAPVLPAGALPDLVDGAGRFRTDMVATAIRLFFGPGVRQQAAAEIQAQFRAFAETGLRLDHVTVHKHFHLHPTVAGLILKIGARFGLRSARVPVEPEKILAAADPLYRAAPAWVTGPWAALAAARFRAAGVWVPDRTFGLRWSGAMTQARLHGLITRLPEGTTEIFLHPGTAGGFLGAADGYAYAAELEGLVSAGARGAVDAAGVRLGGFEDFAHGHADPARTAILVEGPAAG